MKIEVEIDDNVDTHVFISLIASARIALKPAAAKLHKQYVSKIEAIKELDQTGNLIGGAEAIAKLERDIATLRLTQHVISTLLTDVAYQMFKGEVQQ